MPRAFTEAERQRIRAALLRAATEALQQGGLRRAPVEALARAAGISKGAFYQFFDSKESLFMALLQGAEAEVRAALQAAARAGAPADRLGRVLRALFDALLAHPALAGLSDAEEMAWLLRALPPEVFAAARLDDDAFFGALFAALQAEGLLDPAADPRVLAGLAPAALALAQQRAMIGEDRFEALQTLLVEGLVLRLRPAPEAAAQG